MCVQLSPAFFDIYLNVNSFLNKVCTLFFFISSLLCSKETSCVGSAAHAIRSHKAALIRCHVGSGVSQVFLRSGVWVLSVQCQLKKEICTKLSNAFYITQVVTALRFNYGNCLGCLFCFVCFVFYV